MTSQRNWQKFSMDFVSFTLPCLLLCAALVGGETQNVTVGTELGRPSNSSECEALFFYKEVPEFPGYEFRCEFAKGRRGTIKFNYCVSMNDCANTLRNRRQSPSCWRKVESWENCDKGFGKDSACVIRKATRYTPFVATCLFDLQKGEMDWSEDMPRHLESNLGNFAVFGLSWWWSPMPPIYFSEEEINPQKMILLVRIEPYQFPGTNLTVICLVSAYFNHPKDLQIIKYYANRNESQIVQDTGQQVAEYRNQHQGTLTVTMDLGNDPDLSHIYCIGQGSKRSNSSQKIHVHAPKLPTVALHVRDSEGERFTLKEEEYAEVPVESPLQEEWFPHDLKNVSLECRGFGYPPPRVEWRSSPFGSRPASVKTVANDTFTLSRLFFPVIDEGFEGFYLCSAENRLGYISTGINAKIKAPVIGVIISCVGAVLIFLLILFLCVWWWRTRKGKFRELSPEEVSQFHYGDSTVDPKDSNAQIYALTYNQNLEVPPHSIRSAETSLELGAGVFGIVRPGIIKSSLNSKNKSGVQVAVKIPKSNVTTENFKSFLNELKTISFLQNHENVVKILGASTINIKKRRAMIVLEFCELGNLKNFLRDKKKEPRAFRNEFKRSSGCYGYRDRWIWLPESERLETLDLLNFSYGIANGMNYLAEKNVIHGDLAARNILLTGNREVKISDFGFSTQLKNCKTSAKAHSLSIPWRWCSLEVLVDETFSLKSDCWSFGILLYEIFSLGEDPYPEFDRLTPKFVQSLRNGHRQEIPEFANNDIYNLMTECWQRDPNKRPTFAQICDKILNLSVEIVGPKLNLV